MRALPFPLPVLLGLSLFLAGEARAQNTTPLVQFTVPSGKSGLSQQTCQAGETILARVDYNGTISLGVTPPELVVYQAGGSSCPSAGNYTAPDESKVLETQALSEANRALEITITAEDLNSKDCPADTTSEVNLCAVVHQPADNISTFNDTVVGSAKLTLTYDSEPPVAPTGVSGTGGERTVYLSWTSETVSRFVVYYRPVSAPSDEANPCPTLAPADSDAGAGPDSDAGPTDPTVTEEFRTLNVNDGAVRRTSIPDLENDRLYEIFVVSEDAAGNRSAESEHIFATPRVVSDFYRRYRCAGGVEDGGFGCGTSGAAMPPLAALLALALLRRARKHS